MKKIRLLSFLLLVLVVSSCCRKRECVNAFDLNNISVQGFADAELDSILISSYAQGSNFSSTPIEIAPTDINQATSVGDEHIVFVGLNFVPDRDYRIELPKAGLVYDITEIVTEDKKCNSCFLKREDGDYFDMASYQLNGQFVEAADFTIVK